MRAGDVTDTPDLALRASGSDQATVLHKPRLLSDNGASYISSALADWPEDQHMSHVRGAPYHPQKQGKIERWRQTLSWIRLPTGPKTLMTDKIECFGQHPRIGEELITVLLHFGHALSGR